ncbi:hypothetical protein CMV_023056 [Castanea mollissima]|uniref:Uncharacterized protein n=1 Tax=Castanea mollissima TaxID=60419 RepID=A0A8J4QNN2_9ROSI|nr:hypothetical protein CMV_023056 [Castanea mollissima]
MARRILNTCYLVLVLVALSTVAFTIVWTQRNVPLREEDHNDDDEYKEGDYIPLFANKAACPYLGDPCEAYSYFDLPFCPPGDPIPNRKKKILSRTFSRGLLCQHPVCIEVQDGNNKEAPL